VADDKNKEGDGKNAGAPKKRLPAIVLVAVGAIAGGAGVVFAVPPKVVEVKVESRRVEDVDVTHPDALKVTFNPRSRAGKGTARAEFKFVYTVREDREHEAFAAIETNWDEANSKTLMLLKNRSMEELQTDLGLRTLERDLIDELDRALFPAAAKGGTDKVARVTRVLWRDMLFQ
jgi:flagellar basal body-associated protein FliL